MIIVKGDFRNVSGAVLMVVGEYVKIKPDKHMNTVQTMNIPLAHVRKLFEEGDHIKVLSGPSAGETGLVTSVNGASNGLTVFTDANRVIIQVMASQATKSLEV